MQEFLLEYKNTITFSVEILAAVTGLFFLKRYKPTAAKYFIWFLVYLSICDFIGSNYGNHIKSNGFLSFLDHTVFVKNYWWYTLFWKIGAPAFFSFYYYEILINKKFKKIIKYIGISFAIFSFSYIILNWDYYFIIFFPIISILGAIVIFLCTIFYFFEILSSDKVLTFYKSLDFYISAAIFIWWLIITPIVFYDIYISNFDWTFIFLRWQIYLFANIVMYLTFTFALIFCKPEVVKQ